MQRRAILLASGGWILVGSARSGAQGLKRIAVLVPGTQTGFRMRVDAMRSELARLGQVDGRDVLIDTRYADDKTDRLPALAAELVGKKPAVIVTLSSAGISACMKATSTIPIVFTTGGTPVEQGFVSSLRRPGGNVTGILTHPEIVSKIVELVREVLPRAQRFALLAHQPDPAHRGIVDRFVAAAETFRFQPLVVLVAESKDLDRAFSDMAVRKAEALFPANLVFNVSHMREIVDRSLSARLPLFTSYVEGVATESLVAYGTRREENWRRAAALVDKILRGAKPGELPVEQPGHYQMIVNLKTAKAIGVTLSHKFIQRADTVIE